MKVYKRIYKKKKKCLQLNIILDLGYLSYYIHTQMFKQKTVLDDNFKKL